MPKEVFGRDYPFLERTRAAHASRRSRASRASSRARRREPCGSRAASRWCAATSSTSSSCSRRSTPALDDLALTTNGSLLAQKARGARRGRACSRVTVSLDSLDDEVFRAMNDVDFPVARVLDGIDAAAAAGLAGQGQHGRQARRERRRRRSRWPSTSAARGHVLRFIEYMDVGTTNGWRLEDVVPADEIVERIARALAARAGRRREYRREVARRWRYVDGARRDRRHRLRHAAVLRRLHARAPLGRRPALHLPVRRRAATTSARLLRARRRRRGARRARSRAIWTRATTATPSSAPRTPLRCRRSKCRTSAVGAFRATH